MSNLITPSKALGYSNIFLDFLAGSETVRPFYPSDSLEAVAARLDKVQYPRDAVASILEKQNRRYGASQKTLDNIHLFKQENSLAVFSGQQAGLFTGPMLVIIKALAVVKAAHLYSQQLNRPVIPFFWIAGDDHDFIEANHTYLLNRSSELVKISYEARPNPEIPVAELHFSNDEELARVKNLVKETLGDSDYTADLYQWLEESYTGEDTFVTAFGKFMAVLTKNTGLVLFSPGDADAKRIASDLFRRIVLNHDDLQKRISGTNERLRVNGYHIQVEKKDNASHLFYNCEGRRPIMIEGGRFKVGENELNETELINCINEHPERFSPDVMTRPVLQSYLFPVLSQKGGAAEIAYLGQIAPIFEMFDLPTPCYKARPTLTVLETRFEKLMREYDIKFEEMTGDIEQVVNRVMAQSFPHDMEERLTKMRDAIKENFDEFAQTSLTFDPSLKGTSEQIYGKIDFSLKTYEEKIFATHKKKSKETRERVYRLGTALYPNRAFQERSLNITYFLAKYGMGFVDFLYNEIDSEQPAHLLVSMAEYKPS